MGSQTKQPKLFVKVVTIFAPLGFVLQLVAVFFVSPPASALSSGPFSLDIECVERHVVFKLELRQPVAKWITGQVEYQTHYGNMTHHLPPGKVVDTWTLDSGKAEVQKGTVKAKVHGLYQWGSYRETLSINYGATDCHAAALAPVQNQTPVTENTTNNADPLPTTPRSDLPADLDTTTVLSPPVVAQGTSMITLPSSEEQNKDESLGRVGSEGASPVSSPASLNGEATSSGDLPGLMHYWWLLFLAPIAAPWSFVSARRYAL